MEIGLLDSITEKALDKEIDHLCSLFSQGLITKTLELAKKLLENFDASIEEPKFLLALDGLARLYETLTGIQAPKALLTCKDCLVDLD